MAIKKMLAGALIASFATTSSAEALWDMRKVASSSNAMQPLVLNDQSVYATIPTEQARTLIEMVDKFSLLSGIYPKVLLRQSNELNAAAGYPYGEPVIELNKPMFDLLSSDKGSGAAITGHEMAHLYLRHGQKKAEAAESARVAGTIIGTILEILFIGRLGIVGLGTDIGNTFSEAVSKSYSRDFEREADKQGMIWAIQAGYDPDGMTRLTARFEEMSGNSLVPFMNTHPNPGERREVAKERAELVKRYKTVEVLTTPELLELNKRIDEETERQLPKSDHGKAGVIAFDQKRFHDAFKSFQKCAEDGEIACVNNLGAMYQYGIAVPADKQKAAELFKAASNKGSSTAMYNYLTLYVMGVVGNGDVFKIIDLQREAADRGSASAMGALAASSMMVDSFGFPQEWSSKIAAKMPSKSTLLNYAKASAMRGSKEGRSALGMYYLNGYGVPKNISTAEAYLSAASNEGSLSADAALAIIYETERPDPVKLSVIRNKYKDKPKLKAGVALIEASYYCRSENRNRYLKKCYDTARAGRGFASGPAVYGYLISEGIGVKKDPVLGAAWLIYAQNGPGKSFATWMYERIAPSLTDEERQKALALSKGIPEFLAKDSQ